MFLSCLGGFRGRIHLACQCLVSSRFFLWRRIEQENASVLFSHILQPKIKPFLDVVFPPEFLLLVLSAILWRRLGRENKMADKTRSSKIRKKEKSRI